MFLYLCKKKNEKVQKEISIYIPILKKIQNHSKQALAKQEGTKVC